MGIIASLSWGSVTLPEIIWTLSGLVGLAFALPNFMDAQRDAIALYYSKVNGSVAAVAAGNVREELLRVAKCLAIVSTGVIAMALPPILPSRPISALSIVWTTLLFTIAALIVLGSISARRARHATITEARRAANAEGKPRQP